MARSTVRALRELLEGQRLLSIAVLADGEPYAGLLPFVPLPGNDGVLVHASRLARHTQGLRDGARVGVLLHEPDAPDKDPLQIRRAMLQCIVRPCIRDSDEWKAGRDLYLGRFPGSAVTFDLGDFTLYRLEFQRGLYVAGFGRALEIDLKEVSGT
jgi:putative heme iron utilization protein